VIATAYARHHGKSFVELKLLPKEQDLSQFVT